MSREAGCGIPLAGSVVVRPHRAACRCRLSLRLMEIVSAAGLSWRLACRYRVATDDESISIGLPEVKIGLIPAWGGTTRLPRTIGLRRALPILLAGKTMPPRKALRAELIDETVRPEALQAAAKRVVRSGKHRQQPSWFDRLAARLPAARSRMLDAARGQTMEKTHGNYPAPLRLLEVVRDGYEHGFAAGLEAERNDLLEVSETDAGRNLLRLFFLRQAAKKRARREGHRQAARCHARRGNRRRHDGRRHRACARPREPSGAAGRGRS